MARGGNRTKVSAPFDERLVEGDTSTDKEVTDHQLMTSNDYESFARRRELLQVALAAMPQIIARFPNFSADQVASGAFSYADAMLAEMDRRMQNDKSTDSR